MGKKPNTKVKSIISWLICGYLIYAAYQIFHDAYTGADTSLPPAAAYVVAIVYIGVGVGYGLYTLKKYLEWQKNGGDEEEDGEE